MTIPNYQHFMLPVLKAAAKGNVYISDVVKEIADEMHISEEDRKLSLSNGSSLLYGRISWAKSYLIQAGLLESTGRGQFTISSEGVALLAKNPNKIDNKILEQYPSFNAFKKRSKKSSNKVEKTNANEDLDELSPEEAIHESLENLNSSLSGELIGRILKANPTFFENLIIKLLVAMGYSNNTDEAWEHTGKSGDDGIDGVINQDVLGVDKIYIQAKYDFSINLPSPYKLCDFKPAYGEIFNEFISSFDYWGYCDVDLIWGNIRKFLSNDLLDKEYDKIFEKYRNKI